MFVSLADQDPDGHLLSTVEQQHGHILRQPSLGTLCSKQTNVGNTSSAGPQPKPAYHLQLTSGGCHTFIESWANGEGLLYPLETAPCFSNLGLNKTW